MNVNVFNQYYFAFLRKLRDKAREKKDADKISRNLIRAIKNHYVNYDKESEEYIDYYIDKVKDSVFTYDLDEYKQFLEKEETQEIKLYMDITYKNIEKVLESKVFSSGYFLILKIFARKDISDDDVNQIVEILKNKDMKGFNFEEELAKLTYDGDIKDLLKLFKETQEDTNQNINNDFASSFKDLEDTSLGRLAKEIMQDVDLVELQNSLNGENDIFKSLANPEGGLTKLLGTVSQKMISKIATGELKQDTLLQDAIKFSSKLQGNGGNSPFGDLSSMMGKVQEMAGAFGMGGDGEEGGSGGGFDMSMLQTMMSGLAGTMANQKKAPVGGRPAATVNSSAYDRVIKAKQLRKKLEAKRKKSSTKVEDV